MGRGREGPGSSGQRAETKATEQQPRSWRRDSEVRPKNKVSLTSGYTASKSHLSTWPTVRRNGRRGRKRSYTLGARNARGDSLSESGEGGGSKRGAGGRGRGADGGSTAGRMPERAEKLLAT